MRKIKFRAQDFTGTWQYGFVVKGNETAIIIPVNKDGSVAMDINIYVKSDTCGQYTGMKDKDGKEIYEGDVVQNGEGGFFYVVEWWNEYAAFRGKRVGSSLVIELNYWHKELRIVGNRYDNPELLQPQPLPKKRRDRKTLLPGEFRIKGACNNGCMCQPDVIYVARWLTKADGRGKNGHLRIWSDGSWVEDGKRYGSFCDFQKGVLQNYVVLPSPMSREAYEKFKHENFAYPKVKEG